MQTTTSTAEVSSLPFGDLTCGSVMVSSSRAITQKLIDDFAELSGDKNPIHIDVDYAKGTIFGGTIAHGALILSLATGMAAELGIAKLTAIFTDFDHWSFKRPVKPGDSIRLKLTLVSLTPEPRSPGFFRATIEAEIKNQLDKIVQEGTWVARISRR